MLLVFFMLAFSFLIGLASPVLGLVAGGFLLGMAFATHPTTRYRPRADERAVDAVVGAVILAAVTLAAALASGGRF